MMFLGIAKNERQDLAYGTFWKDLMMSSICEKLGKQI